MEKGLKTVIAIGIGAVMLFSSCSEASDKEKGNDSSALAKTDVAVSEMTEVAKADKTTSEKSRSKNKTESKTDKKTEKSKNKSAENSETVNVSSKTVSVGEVKVNETTVAGYKTSSKKENAAVPETSSVSSESEAKNELYEYHEENAYGIERLNIDNRLNYKYSSDEVIETPEQFFVKDVEAVFKTFGKKEMRKNGEYNYFVYYLKDNKILYEVFIEKNNSITLFFYYVYDPLSVSMEKIKEKYADTDKTEFWNEIKKGYFIGSGETYIEYFTVDGRELMVRYYLNNENDYEIVDVRYDEECAFDSILEKDLPWNILGEN